MVKELAEHYEAGERLADIPWEMIDENKFLAARHGMDGELVDLPSPDRVATKELARRLLDRLREHAQDLGCEDALTECVEDLIANGNGAHRQVVVYEANHDLHELMAEISPRRPRRPRSGRARQARPRISPHVGCRPLRRLQELPVGGQPVRHRVPLLRDAAAQAGAQAAGRGGAAPPPQAAGPPVARQAAPGGDAGHPRRRSAVATIALVLATCGVWLAWNGGFVDVDDLVVLGPLDGDWWRVFTTQFVFFSGLAQFFSLVGLGLFGWLVERRWGWPAVLAIFLAAGAGGTAVVALIDDFPIAVGGTGAALGLLCAWAVPELEARRRGEETDGDLLGVAAIAFVLVAMPFARTEIDPLAVVCGGLLGALVGLVVSRVRT